MFSSQRDGKAYKRYANLFEVIVSWAIIISHNILSICKVFSPYYKFTVSTFQLSPNRCRRIKNVDKVLLLFTYYF